jgi:hypothetical protein
LIACCLEYNQYFQQTQMPLAMFIPYYARI